MSGLLIVLDMAAVDGNGESGDATMRGDDYSMRGDRQPSADEPRLRRSSPQIVMPSDGALPLG
jgi:hypothetical protein